jgi:hypothetical protein
MLATGVKELAIPADPQMLLPDGPTHSTRTRAREGSDCVLSHVIVRDRVNSECHAALH